MIIQRVLSLLDEKSLKAADLCRALDISTSTMTNWKNRDRSTGKDDCPNL